MENLVGRQVKGFEFGVSSYSIKDYVGKIGLIKSVEGNSVKVQFEDDYWYYPLDQIQPHLIPLEVFKLGQKVWDMSIQEEAGVVVSGGIFNYPIRAKFGDIYRYYKIGGINPHGRKTLSTTPYTFQGFSQETIIERGTLVYFRGYESSRWSIGFYDEFKHNKHFIFENQQKEGVSFPWTFCQTKNPLI